MTYIKLNIKTYKELINQLDYINEQLVLGYIKQINVSIELTINNVEYNEYQYTILHNQLYSVIKGTMDEYYPYKILRDQLKQLSISHGE